MKTTKTFLIFIMAAILSLALSKRFVSLMALEKDEFSINRYNSFDKTPKIRVENVLYEKMTSVGSIVGAFKPQNKLTNEDVIYLKMKEPTVSVGDKFLIYTNHGGVKDPNKIFGKTGQSVEFKGAVQITSVLPESVTGKIFDASMDIEVGDELTPWRDLTFTVAPQQPTVDVRGRVMASSRDLELIGSYEFAYINLGAKDGLRINDRLHAFMTGDGSRELTKGLPEVNMAEMVVVDLQDKFSTVYVLSAVDRVEAGTAVKSAIPMVRYLNSTAPAESKAGLPNQ